MTVDPFLIPIPKDLMAKIETVDYMENKDRIINDLVLNLASGGNDAIGLHNHNKHVGARVALRI